MKIRIADTEKTEFVFDDFEKILLSELLKKLNIPYEASCGGKGKCGKCRIKISGSLSNPDDVEKSLLSESELADGIRLACRTTVLGDACIYPGSRDIFGITDGELPQTEIKPVTKSEQCVGMAVDIGTTTVAVYFYSLPDGKPIGKDCVMNPQRIHGSDVISRISYSAAGGLCDLTREINEVISDMSKKYGNIGTTVITGNTVMLHLYEGISPEPIGRAPYVPETLFGYRKGKTYFPKCISAYVGADITCAVLSSGMYSRKNTFLIDIGTNGEMVYNKNGHLICCSTAAGPAFEGYGISYGMPAKNGAINEVGLVDGKVVYSVIGGEKPKGICGSGIIDAVAVMREIGVVDESGYLNGDFEIGDSGIFVTASDIREVQLAKAAIRAGIETLSDGGEIEEFFIAGGFGSYVNIESCIKIGMLPDCDRRKFRVIGNAAGMGASAILLNSDFEKITEKTASEIQSIDLSSDSDFFGRYISYMSL